MGTTLKVQCDTRTPISSAAEKNRAQLLGKMHTKVQCETRKGTVCYPRKYSVLPAKVQCATRTHPLEAFNING